MSIITKRNGWGKRPTEDEFQETQEQLECAAFRQPDDDTARFVRQMMKDHRLSKQVGVEDDSPAESDDELMEGPYTVLIPLPRILGDIHKVRDELIECTKLSYYGRSDKRGAVLDRKLRRLLSEVIDLERHYEN